MSSCPVALTPVTAVERSALVRGGEAPLNWNIGAHMHIRRAHDHESEALSLIAQEAKAHWGYAVEVLAAWRADLTVSRDSVRGLPTFVAELEDGIAGFFQLGVSGGELELEHLWVRPSHMGKGIGRALLEQAVREATSAGYPDLHIDADPHAEPFYLACGAVRSGSRPAPIPGEPGRVRPQLVISVRTP